MSDPGIRGCLPRTTRVGERFPVLGTDGTPPLIPNWRDLPDVIDPSLVWHIIDQGNQGSCCACMGAGILMLGREVAGLDRTVISQASIYAQGNGGSDQGMAIDTCLDILMNVGACPIDVIDQYDWQGMRRGTWRADWKEIAKRLRIKEAWDCPTIDHIGSAYKKGFFTGYGARGHAVIRFGDNRDINSWGRDWGNNGIGQWVSEQVLASEIQRYGAWAFRVGTDPDDDGDLPAPRFGLAG